MRRDENTCQYCGKKTSDMTIDHIIPRSRGGGDTWDNLVACCFKCNSKKGCRTPDEAKMPLLKKPRKPNYIFYMQQLIGNADDNWKQFLFFD